MPAPYNNVRSKLTRAVAAYLIDMGCGTPADVTAANYGSFTQDKTYPNTTITGEMGVEEAFPAGNQRITLRVKIRGSASAQDGDPGAQSPRVNFDARCAATNDALRMCAPGDFGLRATAYSGTSGNPSITASGRAMAVAQSADPAAIQFAADNADMADFTCQEWFPKGSADGEPDGQNFAWEEILVFEAICCGKALEGY